MVLLSQMMRQAAFTGSTDSFFTRIAGRQGAQWAENTVRGAYPAGPGRRSARTSPAPPRSAADRASTLRELTDLRDGGVLTDGELEQLRARLRV